MEILFLGKFFVSTPENWDEFLNTLAYDHDIEVNEVLAGLCDWVFSSPEYKRQFEAWLVTIYPLKGQAEDRAEERGTDASEREEARQDATEEEAHEDRDYNEDR
jgi:hypothetical protein